MHDEQGMLSAWPGDVQCHPGGRPGTRRARRATVRLLSLTLSVWNWSQRSRGYEHDELIYQLHLLNSRGFCWS